MSGGAHDCEATSRFGRLEHVRSHCATKERFKSLLCPPVATLAIALDTLVDVRLDPEYVTYPCAFHCLCVESC